MRVCVVGSWESFNIPNEVKLLADELGIFLAKYNHILITGGGEGISKLVVNAYRKSNGKKYTAYFPQDIYMKLYGENKGPERDEEIIINSNYIQRSNVMINQSDIVVALSGHTGTLTECLIAMDANKPIYVFDKGEIYRYLKGIKRLSKKVTFINKISDLKNIDKIDPKTSVSVIDIKGSKLVNYNTATKESTFISDTDLIIVKPNAIKSIENITPIKETFNNNRFYKYDATLNGTAEIIIMSPATRKEIYKMTKTKKRIIETPEIYKKYTYPKIIKQDLTWVYNILEKKQEADRMLFENDDFVLMPDLNWSNQDIKGLYLLAIVKRRDLKSIRDLTIRDVPMLQSIYDISMKLIKDKYDVNSEEVRSYLHYHPSYWHLHIHFSLVNNKQSGTSIDNCHKLLRVIYNLKLKSNYYQKANLEICITNHEEKE